MKCYLCNKSAKLQFPDNMCEEHWIEWWENVWKDYYKSDELLKLKKKHLANFEMEFIGSLGVNDQ